MRFRRILALIIATMGIHTGQGRPSLKTDRCTSLSPDPANVTTFYEANETYEAPASDLGKWKTGTPESQGMKSKWLRDGDKALGALPQPLSFLVLRNDVLIWESYFNGSKALDSNNVHSVSKSILSAIVGIAVERGLFTLDSTLEKLLPANKKNISVRQLLTMTSGLKWTEDETEHEIENTPNWIEAILNLPQASAPGKKFLYSTANTHLLSAILTETSGKNTCELAHELLFDPMGITVEHWGRDPQGYFSGGYNLYLTPRELLKLGKLFLHKGSWERKNLVSPMWTQAAVTPWQQADSETSYGYLWWLYGNKRRTIQKMWGYGGQYVFVVPEEQLVVVMTADTKEKHTELDGDDFLQRYVLAALAKDAPTRR